VTNQPRGGRAANKPQHDRLTKDERREQARLEREEIQARMGTRKRNRVVALIVGLAVAAGVIVLVVMLGSGGSDPVDGDPTGLPGMLTTQAPWPNNTEELPDRLRELDLPGLSEVVNHQHIGLSIFANGEPVGIPADVGLSDTAFSPIHTHDTNGLIHVEADDPDFVATLGEVFDVWGVRLTSDCLGGYCVGADNDLKIFVDGEAYTGDPRTLVLEDNTRVVIAFGSEDQLPDPIPTEPPIAA
jgi:hypothetical protein